MQEYWTNFAKTGDPNGGNLPQWPKFNATARPYLDILDSGPVARKKDCNGKSADLFTENQKRLRAK